jgi:probable HAF family extracellular repeat protein
LSFDGIFVYRDVEIQNNVNPLAKFWSLGSRLSATASTIHHRIPMNLKRTLLVSLGVALQAGVFAQSYNITDLGALLGPNSYAHGINNQGQVVGYWLSTNGARAFLYSSNTVTDLGSLGGTNHYALSINGLGHVVGFAEATNGTSAFLYRNASITNLRGGGVG